MDDARRDDDEQQAESSGERGGGSSGPDESRREIELSEQRSRELSAARKLDSSPGLVKAAKKMREMLPGDSEVGDALSSDGRPSDLLARALAAEEERPSTTRQLGLAAVQVFQALGDAGAQGAGERELSILFTDLVEFSAWVLDAGDEAAVRLLRDVADAVEPVIRERGGRVVKRMGDGYMAVFLDPAAAVHAALDAQEALRDIEVAGHRPKMRAGVHVGKPRKVGRDYLGVDVNIAARVAEAASADQILVSDAVRDALEGHDLKLRKRRFKAKGAPRELEVFEVSAA